jgi:hypothetical protein
VRDAVKTLKRGGRENMMRKLMVLVAALVMMMVSAAPALAQSVETGDVAGGDQINMGNETVFNAVSQNIVGSFEASTTQFGGHTSVAATAGDDAVAVAEIDQSQNVSLVQVNVVGIDDSFGQGIVLARVHGR